MENRSCSSVLDLHHVEVLCSDVGRRSEEFCRTYGFQVLARKAEHVAVRSDSMVFVFRERHSLYAVDTVATLCFAVSDVSAAFARAVGAGGESRTPPAVLTDDDGRMEVAEVATPFGNTSLKFVSALDYRGSFMPGYQASPGTLPSSGGAAELTCGCDHVTYACHQGTLDACIRWFAASLGFQRCPINRSESCGDGFVVNAGGSSVGMRLKAMDYFRCRESQLVLEANRNERLSTITPAASEGRGNRMNVKLVFAEPLYDGPNQVQRFLDEHSGPGIQHIGLTSADIFQTISTMRRASADFIFIPPEFYTQCQQLASDSHVSLPEGVLSRLESSNILLDVEENPVSDSTRYLMQAFTKPLFSESTFFLEVIQRVGATGFGAGNITALWRALQQHFVEQPVTDGDDVPAAATGS